MVRRGAGGEPAAGDLPAGDTARVALITGASGGIGAASARLLAAAGHRVAITYHARAEVALELAAEIGALALQLDLRDRDQVVAVARRVEQDLGPVGILVHNAGLIRDALLPFLSEADWDAVLDVNLKGVYRLTKAVVKGMLGQRWGRVIVISSASGIGGQLAQTHYAAAKAGVIGFVRSLAREVATYGVTANAIAPGYIDTEMLAGIPPKRMAEFVASIPLRRLGSAEEVAGVVAFLASPQAGYITGQALRVDGGLIMA
jgi:NAD(P)-dependent dehydrogenase (short-subunit alcohol dehydrogenase family)